MLPADTQPQNCELQRGGSAWAGFLRETGLFLSVFASIWVDFVPVAHRLTRFVLLARSRAGYTKYREYLKPRRCLQEAAPLGGHAPGRKKASQPDEFSGRHWMDFDRCGSCPGGLSAARGGTAAPRVRARTPPFPLAARPRAPGSHTRSGPTCASAFPFFASGGAAAADLGLGQIPPVSFQAASLP